MRNNEKLLYQENVISQQFILFYILGNTAFTIFYVNNMTADYQVGIFVLQNIFLSLFSFLMAVRQKVYAIQWGYIGVAVAVFQFIRLIWIPDEMIAPVGLLLNVLLITSGIFALVGSVICIKRSQERQKFIVDNKIHLSSLQK